MSKGGVHKLQIFIRQKYKEKIQEFFRTNKKEIAKNSKNALNAVWHRDSHYRGHVIGRGT